MESVVFFQDGTNMLDQILVKQRYNHTPAEDGLACASVNCSHDCSLDEIIVTMPCYSGVDLRKSPSYDQNRYKWIFSAQKLAERLCQECW